MHSPLNNHAAMLWGDTKEYTKQVKYFYGVNNRELRTPSPTRSSNIMDEKLVNIRSFQSSFSPDNY